MERAYREDELLDATVIDSEGYIYGRVGKINVDEDEVTLTIYESKPDTRTMVDIDTLKGELLKNVKMPLSAKLQKLSLSEILEVNIKKNLGLKPTESLTNQHYVKYAERLEIPIPHRKTETERKEPKGSMKLQEIKAIGVSVLRTPEKEKVIKVVLLNDPREATFRNIPVQEKVHYRSTNAVKDKLVLDADGVALGFVDSVVFFHGTPGVRVYVHEPRDHVDLKTLYRYLDATGNTQIAKAMKTYFISDTVRRSEIEAFLQEARNRFILPEDIISTWHVKKFVMDVPWSVIHKVGDVMILVLAFSDLRSKGYLLR